ncbi:cyclase family protein [Streptomyces sp. NPDC055692]|uniref:cyclase family protein n=1 Tax=Streptomyces sp. NPDC055692 TaxID=3155683 RepID=UPI00342D2F37
MPPHRRFRTSQPRPGRGLLIDIDGLLRGRGTPLSHGDGPDLTTDLLDQALAQQGCRVEPGDLVLVHTGWAAWYLTTTPAQAPKSAQNGAPPALPKAAPSPPGAGTTTSPSWPPTPSPWRSSPSWPTATSITARPRTRE